MSKVIIRSIFIISLLFTRVLQADVLDWLVVNGRLVDGTGAAERIASVGAVNGRLRVFEHGVDLPAARHKIDAAGMVIAPGFIDMHTHARADLLSKDKNAVSNYLTQGVTTLAIGNDGDGTPNIADRFALLAEGGTGTNVVQFVGHGSLRRQVVGNDNRLATEAELVAMEQALEQSFAEGAAGLSLGLFYTPGNYAPTSEVVRLCKVAARWGRICEAHIRSESSRGEGVFAAVEEMLEIARQSGVAIHFAHIKVLGKDVWGESDRVINMISKAQAEGLHVTADQYPWIASSTQLKNAILSAQWLEGTRSAWRERLQDPANESAVLEDLRQGIARRGGGERLMLVSTGDQTIEGLMLSEVAERWSVSPEFAALKLLREAPPRVVSFNMNESDVENFMAEPWVATSSDGTDGHPRKYASFPRKYARYVLERQVLTLEQFVERSSALPARILGLIDRGVIASGNTADVIVFDPRRYKDAATFEQWDRLTPGVEWMFINGKPVIEHGRYLGALVGQNLALPANSARVDP